MPELCELVKDEHFKLKLVDAFCSFYGVKNLLEYGYFRNTMHAFIISMAFGGGFLATCLLIYMYYKDAKNDTAEDTVLTMYGVINLMAAYILIKRKFGIFGCSNYWFNPLSNMICAALGAAASMIGEVAYYKHK